MVHMKVKVDINSARACEASPDGEQVRCLCGGMVARLVPSGVELKCRRCRRILVVPLVDALGAEARS
jgi:hypothetical protein